MYVTTDFEGVIFQTLAEKLALSYFAKCSYLCLHIFGPTG